MRRFSPYTFTLIILVFIDPDSMQATNGSFYTFGSGDFNTMIDFGYGMMRDSRSIGGAIDFSGEVYD